MAGTGRRASGTIYDALLISTLCPLAAEAILEARILLNILYNNILPNIPIWPTFLDLMEEYAHILPYWATSHL
jgi:hypothetical protein